MANHSSSLSLGSGLSSLNSGSLSWDSFLPNHVIFKALEKDAKVSTEESYLGKNILAEQNGDLFLWDDGKKHILVANLKNLKAKNERSSKLQTLLCTNPPAFNVNKMVFSQTGIYLALVGKHGVCVIELPQKRGKFTQFEHGKETISCRAVHLDEHFFTCHQTVLICEAKWFPGSSNDVHLVLLTSDNRIRLFDITRPNSPQDVISVGSIPSSQSLCSPLNVTFAEAFGEVVVSFDFAPTLDAEMALKKGGNENQELAYPVFLLRENGDVLYLLLMLKASGFYYELHGCLSMYPPAEDNYGADSCAILCFPTNPVVVAITTCSGIIYHCIVLDNEEDVFDKSTDNNAEVKEDERDASYMAPTLSLYVYECVELALVSNSEIERTFEESSKVSSESNETKDDTFAVNLFKDPVSGFRYHCYHPFGVHTVTLSWVKSLQQYCNETAKAVSFDPNEDGVVQHLICTNPVPSCALNLVGFTVIGDWELGATVVALTDAMDCITRPLRFLNRPPSPSLLSNDPDTGDRSLKIEDNSSSLQALSGEFKNRVKQILKRDFSNPLLRSCLASRQITPKDCLQFLAGATQTFRLEYINKQTLAQEEIEKRLEILGEQNKQQTEDLRVIYEEKKSLQDRMTILAEKYEDTKDRQEGILTRIHKVLEFIQSRQPVLCDAEVRMKEELQEICRNIQTFQKSFDQLEHKRNFLRNKLERMMEPRAKTLPESHKKQLKTFLKEEGDTIQNLVNQVNNLKLEVGY